MARQVLSEEPGPLSSMTRVELVVKEEVTAAGACLGRARGTFLHEGTMRRLKAPFGLELSGHFYFRDNFCADSGVIAMISLLNLVSRERKSLSELVRPLRRYSSTGEINFEVEDKDRKIEEISRKFTDGRQSRVDGITVEYDDLVVQRAEVEHRTSLEADLEGKTRELMDAGLARVKAVLGKALK